MQQETGYPIELEKTARYLWLSQLLFLLPLFGRRHAMRQAQNLQYRIEGATLRIEQGVFIRQSVAVAMDQVTDVTLVQGPVMRRLGIWAIWVRVAGPSSWTIHVLLGVRDPEDVRKSLLAVHDRAMAEHGRPVGEHGRCG